MSADLYGFEPCSRVLVKGAWRNVDTLKARGHKVTLCNVWECARYFEVRSDYGAPRIDLRVLPSGRSGEFSIELLGLLCTRASAEAFLLATAILLQEHYDRRQKLSVKLFEQIERMRIEYLQPVSVGGAQ